ncbi:hypothetical protein [Pedobacter cryoconitis]|uniref:Uncharacterized protein n=1 Tax=Pedobacter cryoconitis TaxID=188932 RepID=A0A7X0ML17_9SPHI|nr:hypothetical protein [Pedobacter cryoconitis]MBB6502636.1 hypothetical protein [Pedobacter cryoconitis]
MKKTLLICLLFLTKLSFGQNNSEWNGTVTFPADYKVGDYIEFLHVQPINVSASGNYEVSISYTRGNLAAGATYLASISHGNPNIWREVGRVNSNGYAWTSSDGHAFTLDCNTQYGDPRLRIRAIRVLGVTNEVVTVSIKVRSISQNSGWRAVNDVGTDLTVDKFLAMTNDWSLYVGNNFDAVDAKLAIKATVDGNVGIGTANPKERLSVNGNIRAKAIKVETANWPDYVFHQDYQGMSLPQLEEYIKVNKHLPEMPSAQKAEKEGVDLGEMNKLLLKKIEEMTLQMIELNRKVDQQNQRINQLSQKG